MASKRGVRRKSCFGKIKFDNEDAARKNLQKFTDYRHKIGDWTYMHVYRCSECGNWHIGHVQYQHRLGFVHF